VDAVTTLTFTAAIPSSEDGPSYKTKGESPANQTQLPGRPAAPTMLWVDGSLPNFKRTHYQLPALIAPWGMKAVAPSGRPQFPRSPRRSWRKTARNSTAIVGLQNRENAKIFR
jgi:hypothetical protein